MNDSGEGSHVVLPADVVLSFSFFAYVAEYTVWYPLSDKHLDAVSRPSSVAPRLQNAISDYEIRGRAFAA